MNKKELIERVVHLKQSVERLRTAGVLQKTKQAELILEDAVFLMEKMVLKIGELEGFLNGK